MTLTVSQQNKNLERDIFGGSDSELSSDEEESAAFIPPFVPTLTFYFTQKSRGAPLSLKPAHHVVPRQITTRQAPIQMITTLINENKSRPRNAPRPERTVTMAIGLRRGNANEKLHQLQRSISAVYLRSKVSFQPFRYCKIFILSCSQQNTPRHAD